MTCVACDFNIAALSDCSEQLQKALAEIEKLKKDFNEQGLRKTAQWCEERHKVIQLTADLAHSDAERRMLQRDILAQQEILKRFAPFHVVSPALQKGQSR